jgi:hypothetical protein
MDRFVPRDDGSNVIASEARQSMDCFVPRNDGVGGGDDGVGGGDDGGGCAHAHYKCYAYVQPERLAPGWSRDRIVEAFNAEGVPCYQGSCSEVYLEGGGGSLPAKKILAQDGSSKYNRPI